LDRTPGTSQDWRDVWFVGYTSRLVTGVWLGNDDSSPTRKATGGGLPVEVWSQFMKAAHQGKPATDLPFMSTGLTSLGAAASGGPALTPAAAVPGHSREPIRPAEGTNGWLKLLEH
jgi:penicillin-binding protein 1A